MSDIYYVGDTITLRFQSIVNNEGGIQLEVGRTPEKVIYRPDEVTVSIYTDEGEVIHDAPAEIGTEYIKYVLDKEYTTHAGDYLALFSLRYAPNIEKSHPIRFVVLPRGLPKETENTPVALLDKDSLEDVVESAVSATIRALRRSGVPVEKAAKVTYLAAQLKKGKRILK